MGIAWQVSLVTSTMVHQVLQASNTCTTSISSSMVNLGCKQWVQRM
jgi:hypothetical protein